ncbi:MAG: hypothetical protein AB1631_32040 [Acidobacteriota bacterium]
MATKTYLRENEDIVITIHDGPAAGSYKLHAPEIPQSGLLTIGHLFLETKTQNLIVRISDMQGLAASILEARRLYLARLEVQEAARVDYCERCGAAIPKGEEVWREDRVCHTPFCQLCAKLLRIAAGGIGVEGEPLTARDDDRTPYTKGDF